MKTRKENGIIRRVEHSIAVQAVRNGLTSLIPVLIIGAFALILKTFPVTAYQNALQTAAGGFFLELFDIVINATFGVLSVFMTFSVSRSYMKLKADADAVAGGAVIASLISFFILAGAYLPGFGTDSMGPKSMFLAILTGLGASALYLRLFKLFSKRRSYLYTTGADREFNRMLSTLFPVAIVAIVFAIFNAVIIRVFDADSFRELIAKAFNALFSVIGNGFVKGFFFVLLSSVLWFFGIHGSDTLENVMQTYFAPGLAANQAAVASGGAATEVLTKEFFDCFVLMGGCGTTICLLIAILLFSRNRARKRLGLTAAVPMIFNINELMVFGLPIIFNPIMLIPFLAVPLVCYTTAYIAVSTGLVPMITNSVDWTTPIILGGYSITGSVAGAILQLVNVVLGAAIYTPFVRMLDRKSEEEARRGFESFVTFFKENEQELASARLADRSDIYGDFAKALTEEFRHDMKSRLKLYYQPQYRYDGSCAGAEALLRWEHPVHGMVYPPLLVKLAEDGGFLPELEEAVVSRAVEERDKVVKRFGEGVHLSVNVTGTTVVSTRFMQFCRKLNSSGAFDGKDICFEVTEQAALSFNDETVAALGELKKLGVRLAIDDFSMGQTSIHYLKDSLFDIIKLDGSLVRDMFEHRNSQEIISSIVALADSLDLTVVAEYVESEKQREMLHGIGCDCYQGYLYSPAIPLD